MAELPIDPAVANRFISSLSKSLQALCHGCMDFDSGIEIGGYIYVNIDSSNKVDYVLNEKVNKGANNSMTFVSNSFLAKKDSFKQTRDGACSPVPELQSKSFPSHSHHMDSFHNSSAYPYSSQSHVSRGAKKRSWSGMDRDWRGGAKKHFRGGRASLPLPYDHQAQIPGSSNGVESGNDSINVKKELFDSADHREYSESDNNYGGSVNVKTDPDTVLQSGEGDGAGDEETEPAVNFPEPSSSRLEAVEGQSSSADIAPNESSNTEHSNVNQANNDNSEMQADYNETEENSGYPQSSYTEQSDTSRVQQPGFDVIEIGDEDEDVQAMFGDNRMHFDKHRNTNLMMTHSKQEQLMNLASFIDLRPNEEASGILYDTSSSDVSNGYSNTYNTTGMRYRYQCNTCGKGYMHLYSLTRHELTHQGSGKHFLCPLCDTTFTQKSSIKTHLKAVHKSKQCINCSDIFPIGDDYDLHVRQCILPIS